MTDLCPACARNEVDTPSGFCTACVVDRAASRYSDADRERAATRTRTWGKATTQTRTDARLAVLRQQRKRQIAAVRPTKPSSSLDPWELAIEGITMTKRIAQSHGVARHDLDEIAEILRRLAWGPDDGEAWIGQPRPRHKRQIPGQLTLFPESVEVAA